LASLDFVGEKKKIGFRERWLLVRLNVAEDLRGRPVLHRQFVGGGGANVGRMKRAGDDGIADGGTFCSERKEGDAKFSVEGIRSSAEDGDVVGPVCGNDVGFEELRR